MTPLLPEWFLKTIFSSVADTQWKKIPQWFEKHIKDFSEYAEKLPLDMWTKQITRHIKREIRNTFKEEISQENTRFYVSIKKELLIALHTETKKYIKDNKKNTDTQKRDEKIIPLLRDFLLQQKWPWTINDIVTYSFKTKHTIKGESVRNYLNNHYNPFTTETFKKILGEENYLLKDNPFKKEIRRSHEDIKNELEAFLQERESGSISINQLWSKLYSALYIKHWAERPNHIVDYIWKEKAKLYPISRKITFKYEDIKKRMRPFLLDMILKSQIIRPSLIKRKSPNDAARIKNHCRCNGKIDRLIAIFKCFDEDIIEKMTFKYHGKDIFKDDVIAPPQRYEDISEANYWRGIKDKHEKNPEEILIEKEELDLLEKAILQLPKHLRSWIVKFRKWKEVNPEILHEAITLMRKHIELMNK